MDDKKVMDLTGEVLDVCVLSSAVVGKTLAEMNAQHGHGCFLRQIMRHGHELPLENNTVIQKCDILKVAGLQKDVEDFVKYVGHSERVTGTTDFITVGFGCAIGILLGLF